MDYHREAKIEVLDPIQHPSDLDEKEIQSLDCILIHYVAKERTDEHYVFLRDMIIGIRS